MANERLGNLGKAVHISNPPGYNKIFTILASGSTGITAGDIIPRHRALLITNSSTSSAVSVTVTNSDGTTSVLTIAVSTTLTLPIQIISYASATSANLYIYGLL